MTGQAICAHCREPFENEPVVKLGKIYCCEACVFEATGRPRPKQCGVTVPEEKRAS